MSKNYKEYFKNKRVTVVGLGLLGKRLGDIAFLSECGAKVLVTDTKSAKDLAPSVNKLKKYKNITYVLGEHRMEDFENCDMVLKGQGVALDSPYIAHARKNGIPIEMDESLFAKLAPEVKIIGITGTRGKSTTTVLIYEILKAAGLRVHLGGNIKGTAALPLLKEVKAGDTVVFELSSWQLQGFGDAKISPSISVFTNFMPDHMNYYKDDLKQYFTDKAYIYKYQKAEDALILGPSMKLKVESIKSKVIKAHTKIIPKNWKIGLKGAHNMENIACALEAAKVMGVKEAVIKKAVENFKAVSGRMELVKTVKGVEIYNDTNACTPEATSVALQTLGKNIILIVGGTDKNLVLKNLENDIKKYTKAVVLLPGNGTDRLKVVGYKAKDLIDAVSNAYSLAKKGDTILFSPAFTSFGMFQNEYDRGEKFMKIIKALK
ncbi:MAG: UDP-N-acetylmuramoyl-L-alanine--D-glutamate ligase [Candidatus Pacebacteria bacterium]|nr:UDP-N-acetylmuramoyl-L-alanine--D-glutamate ligase [Candidatus Paceibacterota bacterium]